MIRIVGVITDENSRIVIRDRALVEVSGVTITEGGCIEVVPE